MSERVRFEAEGAFGVLTFETPGRKINSFDSEAIAELERVLDTVESRHGLRGLVLASAHPDVFLSGADLGELERISSPEQAEAWLGRAQETLHRIARLPCPTVAAVRGAALGGGLEVALACTDRVATDEPATMLGLPEVQLGLMPAAGGTWRLPRLVGFRRGLDLILTGRRVGAREAEAIGLVDEVVPREALAAACRRRLAERPRRARKPGLVEKLAGSWLGRRVVVAAASRAVKTKTGSRMPAPLAALEAARAGGRAAEAIERRRFGELALSPESRALVGLFLATRRARPRTETAPGDGGGVVGVVGAGLMGAGIASVAAGAGATVRLLDAESRAVGEALAAAARAFERRTSRRRAPRGETREVLARMQATRGFAGLRGCGLVIEAVFEDLAIKRRVLAQVAAEVPLGTVIASNTSTLPIAALAEGIEAPERVVGLHFFSPVPRMPLVEIVRPEGASPEAIGLAVRFVGRLGKTPIVVRDGPGFYTTRVVGALTGRALAEFGAGHSAAAVDAAGRQAGFPVGPLTLLDELGLDVAAHAARTLHEAFPARFGSPEPLERMVAEGRRGRKSGAGFYDYRGRRRLPSRVGERASSGSAVRSRSDLDRMAEELRLAMVAEAIRCLDEGIVASPADGDLGAVLGLGFPPETGGPFRWADRIGAAALVERLSALEGEAGPAFEPPPLLLEAARLDLGFHQLSGGPALRR